MPTALNSLILQNLNFTVQALVNIFTDLRDRTSETAGTINITNCYGASQLTADQRLIATDKNWTITG
jgi:hypothetical protein